jgi:hypothetical protein
MAAADSNLEWDTHASFDMSKLPSQFNVQLALATLCGFIGVSAFASSSHRVSLTALPFYFERHDQGGYFVARTGSGSVIVQPTLFSIEAQRPEESAATSSDNRRNAHARKFESRSVVFEFADGLASASIAGLEALPGKVNYLIGSNPADWKVGLPLFGRMQATGVYPGIDVVYYGSHRLLEYDIHVAPHADPAQVRVQVRGADAISLSPDGDLLIELGTVTLRKHKPVAHQVIGGRPVSVDAGFVLEQDRVSFALGAYDPDYALVIDPVLSFSTYLGGSGDESGWDLALDPAGSVYIAGDTTSANLPASPDAVSTNYGGTLQNLGGDAFVAKFNNTGTTLQFLTYLGGNSADAALGLTVDPSGNAYVVGVTSSTNFPIANAISNRLSGIPEMFFGALPYDAFVTKLSSGGNSLIYSTYLGGNAQEQGIGIDVDSQGQAFVTGFTESTNFPVVNAITNQLLGLSDVFITKINAQGSAFIYSTFLGGEGVDHGGSIAVDPNGFACITGYTLSETFPVLNGYQTSLNRMTNNDAYADAFLSRISPGGALVFSTFLGGFFGEYGYRVAVDSDGNSYVTGTTSSTNFPTTLNVLPAGITSSNFASDAFLAKFNPAGNVIYSTTYGGLSSEAPWDLEVDQNRNVLLAGVSSTVIFPSVSPGPGLTTTNSGINDVFLALVNSSATEVIYSGLLGGRLNDAAFAVEMDSAGNAYLTGETYSGNFPLASAYQTNLVGSSDAFVCKVSVSPTLTVSVEAQTVTLSWPAFNPEFQLETRSLDASAEWIAVSDTPVLAGGKHVVTLQQQASALFRLRHTGVSP